MSIADIHRRYAGQATIDHSDEQAHDSLLHNGGFSRHVLTGEEPKSGYMVGLHGDHGGEESIHDLHDLTPQHIAEHRQRAANEWGLSAKHVYQGGWAHDGKAYLDRSVNVDDHDEAMNMARKHQQLAIWDVTHKREIPLGE